MVVNEKFNVAKIHGVITIWDKESNQIVQFDRTHPLYSLVDAYYRKLASTQVGSHGRTVAFADMMADSRLVPSLADILGSVIGETTAEATAEPVKSATEYLTEAISKTINFFKEFEFEPNFRFINTLSFKAQKSNSEATSYINNYFSLIDNTYKNEIASKCNSKEFKEILKMFHDYANPSNHINQRFAVYYGSAGTGKTTLAMKESDNRCIVCNASMLPSDLMEDFVFSNGQPTFQKSNLWNCMENGLPIVFDEINLLPFDSLRFLQGILDGKKEFDYKGHKVTIADGFKIIGTMNLSIGGMIFGLPEPLIDRCADIQKFSLTAEQLLGAVI